MKLLIATVGLPRSGKSTKLSELARELGAPIVSRDAIRLALHGQRYAMEAEDFTRAFYKLMVRALFEAGSEIVLADETHYSRAARMFISDGPWETRWLEVQTPPEICKERAIATNQHDLLPVIDSMVARYESLEEDEIKYVSR